MLTKKQIHQICKRLKRNFREETYKEIAEDYGVSLVAIFQIRKGHIHRDISDQYFDEKFRDQKKRRLTFRTVADMKRLAEENGYYDKHWFHGKEIAKTLQVSKHMVYDILYGRCYADCGKDEVTP